MKNFLQTKNKYFIVLVITIFFFFAFTTNTFAAVKCWVGGTDGVWSNASNWQTTAGATSALTSGDIATFDPSKVTCTGAATTNTSSTIDSTAIGNVTGIDIKAAYNQTITQAAGITVAVGASSYIQAGGTYTATTGTFDNNGNFTLSAGTFTPPTTANTIAGSLTISGTGNYNIGATATTTFDGTYSSTVTVPGALGGKVAFNKGNSWSITITIVAGTTIDLGNSPTAVLTTAGGANLINNGTIILGTGTTTINCVSGYGTFTNNGTITSSAAAWVFGLTSFTNSANATTTFAGTTMTIGGNFTFGGSLTAGSLTSIFIAGNFTKTSTFDLTGKTVTFNGPLASIVTASGTLGGTVVIGKTANGGTFTVAAGTSINLGDNPTSTTYAHNIVNNGTIIINSGTWTVNASANWGQVLINNGTITHNGNGWIFSTNFGSFTNNTGATTTYAGTTISLPGNLVQNGTFDLTGKTVTFNGASSASVTSAGVLGGTIVVTKGAGYNITFTVTAGSTVNLGNSATMTLGTSGLDNLINNGTMIVGSGTWTINGYNNGIGTFTNNGTITSSGSDWVVNTAHFVNNGTTTYSGTTMSFYNNFTQNGVFDLTGKTVNFIGGFDQTVTATAGLLGGKVVINKNTSIGFTFTIAAGTSINLGDSPNTVANTYNSITNNGTIVVNSGTWTLTNNYSTQYATLVNNGVITHNGDGWVFTGNQFGFTNNANATTTYAGTGITINASFTQNGVFDLTGKTITFNGAFNATLTTALSTVGCSIVLAKSAANTLTLANNISVINATTTTGILSNPATAKVMTVAGNLSIADGAKFGGANLSVVMSSTTSQNISLTTGGVLSPIQINKTGGVVTLQSNYTGSGAASIITITNGSLYLNGKNLSATTTVTGSGELKLFGSETISIIPTLDVDSTVVYTGDGDTVSDSYTLKTYPYYNLIASSTDSIDVYNATNTSDILGSLTIKGGNYNTSTTLNIGGNLVKTEGGFWATSTDLTLNGTNQAITLNASTTIASLTKIASTTNDTLTFGTTGALIITGTTTLQGTADYTLSLRSTATGTPWYFQPDGIREFSYLNVQDSNNTSSTPIETTGLNITDGGGNINWTFGGAATLAISKSGTQIATTTATSTDQDLGGAFSFLATGGNLTVDSIKIKQIGSFPDSDIENIRLYYKQENTCSVTKPTGTTLFDTIATLDENGEATSTGSIALTAASTTCLYIVYDLTGTAGTSTMGRSIDFEITNPLTDVLVTGGTVSTVGKVNITGRTMIIFGDIVSILSLHTKDETKNPTIFYLQNGVVYKKEGTNDPISLTNPNLQVHDLSFTDMGAGYVRIEITVSNMDPGQGGTFLNVTRTLKTTAGVRAWSGND